jgi:hypothetical protein
MDTGQRLTTRRARFECDRQKASTILSVAKHTGSGASMDRPVTATHWGQDEGHRTWTLDADATDSAWAIVLAVAKEMGVRAREGDE